MDLDQPELSEPLPGEAPETFIGRIRLSRRVLPILQDLVAHRFSLVVESDRRTSSAASLTSDFVLEFGDSRLRLILAPGDRGPMHSGFVTISSLAHYMLDVPDTDAVAVVADDDDLTTWIFDVYALNTEAAMEESAPIGEAINGYFEDTVHPIELPNFRGVLSLPTTEQLESTLEREAGAALERIRRSRARISEKITALGTIGPEETSRLVETLLHALRGEKPSLSMLIPEQGDEDHD